MLVESPPHPFNSGMLNRSSTRKSLWDKSVTLLQSFTSTSHLVFAQRHVQSVWSSARISRACPGGAFAKPWPPRVLPSPNLIWTAKLRKWFRIDFNWFWLALLDFEWFRIDLIWFWMILFDFKWFRIDFNWFLHSSILKLFRSWFVAVLKLCVAVLKLHVAALIRSADVLKLLCYWYVLKLCCYCSAAVLKLFCNCSLTVVFLLCSGSELVPQLFCNSL